MENGYIESFHGKLREACLNEHWLLALEDVRETIACWRIDYNQVRLHSSDYMTPVEFVSRNANVEGQERLPHSHRRDGGCEQILQLNSSPSTLTYSNETKGAAHIY
jgi:putative transposase